MPKNTICIDGTFYLVPPEFTPDQWREQVEDFIAIKSAVVRKRLARLHPSDLQGRFEVWKRYGAWGVRLKAETTRHNAPRRVC